MVTAIWCVLGVRSKCELCRKSVFLENINHCVWCLFRWQRTRHTRRQSKLTIDTTNSDQHYRIVSDIYCREIGFGFSSRIEQPSYSSCIIRSFHSWVRRREREETVFTSIDLSLSLVATRLMRRSVIRHEPLVTPSTPWLCSPPTVYFFTNYFKAVFMLTFCHFPSAKSRKWATKVFKIRYLNEPVLSLSLTLFLCLVS